MKKTFIIIDMSNDFVHDEGNLTAGKAAQEIVPYVIKQANEFIQNGDEVIIAMDTHQPNDPHFNEWPAHNVIGTWGQELYGDLHEWYLENKENQHVTFLPKPQYDAFYKTNLEEILKERKVEEVHLSGVATDICVFLTASGAYYRGIKTVVHKQGTATFTGQFEQALKHMELIFKAVIMD